MEGSIVVSTWDRTERVDAPDRDTPAERLRAIDALLSEEYGRPLWHAHGDPLSQLIATVLSQHTSDRNTERAFASLRSRFPDWAAVRDAPTDAIADAIRSGGLANIKAPRIQRILDAIEAEVGELALDHLRSVPIETARSWLTDLPGVGPKTAACVLLFSLGMPAMPVDTHVYRVSARLGLVPPGIGAEAAHDALETLVGAERDTIYALHLNLIRHGRSTCRARNPACDACFLSALCPRVGL